MCKDCPNPNCPKCGTTHPIGECIINNKMRDATKEEREGIEEYIKSISIPTDINFWDYV